MILFWSILCLCFVSLSSSSSSSSSLSSSSLHYSSLQIYDHTYVLSSSIPTFSGVNDFSVRTLADFPEDPLAFRTMDNFPEHFGTHIDAPYHFGGVETDTIDKIDAKDLIGPLCIIDIEQKVFQDNNNNNPNFDYALSVDDLLRYEDSFGPIPPHAIVVMKSGWFRRWGNVDAYRNVDDQGIMRFPGFSKASLEWLLDNRDVIGVGVDTISIDIGSLSLDEESPAHYLWQGANKWCLENLAALDDVPQSGALMVVSPIMIVDGTGGTARVYSFIANPSPSPTPTPPPVPPPSPPPVPPPSPPPSSSLSPPPSPVSVVPSIPPSPIAPPPSPPPLPTPSPSPSSSESSNSVWWYFFLVVVIIFIISAFAAFGCYWKRKMAEENDQDEINMTAE